MTPRPDPGDPARSEPAGQSSWRIAVLGTGIMGAPMARHLHDAGHEVRAWDIDPSHLAPLEDLGIHVARTAAEATADADAVITMLTDGSVVEDVMTSETGALTSFSGLWLQTTTVGLEGTRRLAALAEDHHVVLVDAPLLGTKPSAENGQLTALGSGPASAEQASRAVLDAFCSRVLWVGPTGEGSRLKLVMNSWVIGLTTLTAQTVALSAGLGLDPTAFLDLIRGGPLDAEQAQIKGRAMLDRRFDPALPLRLAAKDARLIVAAIEEAGVESSLARAVARQLEAAQAGGHGDEDYSAVWYAVAPHRSEAAPPS